MTYKCANKVFIFGENLSTEGWENLQVQDSFTIFDEDGFLQPLSSSFVNKIWDRKDDELEDTPSLLQNKFNSTSNLSNPSSVIRNKFSPKPFYITKVKAGFSSTAYISSLGECYIESNPQYSDFSQYNFQILNENYYIEDISCGYTHCVMLARRRSPSQTSDTKPRLGTWRSFPSVDSVKKLFGTKRKSNTFISKKERVLIAAGGNSYNQCGFLLTPIQDSNFFEISLPEIQHPIYVIAVTCGYHHTLFLMNDHSIWTAGRPILQVYSTHQNQGYLKFQVFNGDHVVPIRAIAAGNVHNIAVGENGAVYTWGKNSSGQLGLGSMSSCEIPTRVTALAGHKIIAASAGYSHSVFLSSIGEVFTCGDCTYGRTGRSVEGSIPLKISLNGPASSISAGGYHTLVGLTDGSVYAMGHSGFGQCGIQPEKNKYYTEPRRVRIPEDDFIVDVSAGGYHSVVLERETEFSRERKRFFKMISKSIDAHFCDVVVCGDWFG